MIRGQYKVLSEKYKHVSETTDDDYQRRLAIYNAEQNYNTNSIVKMVIPLAKKYVDVYYNASSNSIEEILQIEKEKKEFLAKYRSVLIPLEKPDKKGLQESVSDLLYDLIFQNIEKITNSGITYTKSYTDGGRKIWDKPLTPADLIMSMIYKHTYYAFSKERGSLGDKIAAPYLRDADKNLKQSIEKWEDYRKAQEVYKQGTQATGGDWNIGGLT